ncbi:nickel/cobalt transporter [Aestuariispira insulae]|uniref:Nickel/cobalt efflux system n=1 Tax=Aestuariispira insulae TaxID=1461337 RepID=A0A3D9H8F0_9PROT|nr:nickel/cobalt transporter [Aestuariispira insulae]RED45782.1 ABC-type nickel/cobalt efflux system permease component RcnA [Aestuariispira insulae]
MRFVIPLLLLSGLAMAAAGAGNDVSIWGEFLQWVIAQQKAFHADLTEGLKTLKNDGGFSAAWALILASFLYGVFHAAGPGHGKVVLTTYLVTQKEKVGRGILLATLAAFCQGLVALVLVYGLIYLAGWLPRETSEAVTWSERMSYALVALIGIMLVWRAAKAVIGLRTASASHSHNHHHDHHHHDHHQGHDTTCSSCGHAHAPTADQLEGNWKTALGVILSIGLRPCSGAVLVLVFAKALKLSAAGVAAVAAMSLGTAIAVAVLALVAVNARNLAGRLVAQGSGRLFMVGGMAVALSGGLLLVALGGSLLANSWQTAHPLGL